MSGMLSGTTGVLLDASSQQPVSPGPSTAFQSPGQASSPTEFTPFMFRAARCVKSLCRAELVGRLVGSVRELFRWPMYGLFFFFVVYCEDMCYVEIIR